MKYKAKDIARELGVSPTTISLVINNKPGVGEEKRKEIIRKIIEMDCEYLLKDYAINKGDIGVIVYKCGGTIIDEYPVFNYISERVVDRIKKNNYEINVMYLDSSMSLDSLYMSLENPRYAGYIVYAVEMYPKDMELFYRLKAPCVFIDNPLPTVDEDVVVVDNYRAIYEEFEYLYEMGHREIGYIKSKIPIICFDERYAAYVECMKRRGLRIREDYIMDVAYLRGETERDVEAYLERGPKLPTAFMADNDLLSCRAVQVFKKRGIRVPDEISFIGFDDRPICSFTEPKVATMHMPCDEIGELAVDLLIQRIEKKRSYAIKCHVGAGMVKNESVKRISAGEGVD